MVIPAVPSTVVRLLNAFSTCSPMSEVVGGEPSSPVAVWPEHSRTCDAPATSTACENPNALDHSQGLTSVRSIVRSSIVTSSERYDVGVRHASATDTVVDCTYDAVAQMCRVP